VIVSNPIKTKTIAQAKIKTDKIDARVLAELAGVGYLPEVWLPDEDTEALRQFITDRVAYVRRRTECKNVIHSVLHRNMVHQERSDLFGTGGRQWLESIIRGEGIKTPVAELDRMRIGSLLNEIDRIDALVADLESVIASYVALRPHLKEQLDRLLSITGVNLVVASSLIGTIGDIGRFPDKKKLAAYFGVVPSTYQSGDTSRNGRITKQGRAEARWLIIEAAEILRRSPGPMRALYSRIQRKRNHNVAVVAVARNLVELVHHLFSNREDYVYKLPRLTMEKRARWRFLAKKKLGIRQTIRTFGSLRHRHRRPGTQAQVSDRQASGSRCRASLCRHRRPKKTPSGRSILAAYPIHGSCLRPDKPERNLLGTHPLPTHRTPPAQIPKARG
jgi:transposase